ncbi:MAG: nucleotide exchange factor GrpE [Alphaproteobacteria bacterium HGW-Alphaproteobacteria-12]|nr:MAG: nucleotide exchange factor GrpE [Alphaproteobacteria bacterium HGW-Alphaproteobacteria-12]
MSDEQKKSEAEDLENPEKLAEILADEPAAQGEAEDVAAEPETVLLAAEIADLRERLLRMGAELDNTRKRAERERQDASRYAVANFARDMLEVSDNLRRALATLKEEERAGVTDSVASLIEGVEMTDRLLAAIFERHGIREITPKPGERFDPNLHEAMFEVPDSGQPAGTVVHVLEAGYKIGERLLRAARVGVAKAEDGARNGGRIDTTA